MNPAELTAERKLATAVLKQAAIDITRGSDAARDFLCGVDDSSIELWCELLGINPDKARKVATQGFSNQPKGAHNGVGNRILRLLRHRPLTSKQLAYALQQRLYITTPARVRRNCWHLAQKGLIKQVGDKWTLIGTDAGETQSTEPAARSTHPTGGSGFVPAATLATQTPETSRRAVSTRQS